MKTIVKNLGIDIKKIYYLRIFRATGFGLITCFPGTIMGYLPFPLVYMGPILVGVWNLFGFGRILATLKIGIFEEPTNIDSSGISIGGVAFPLFNYNFVGMHSGSPIYSAGGLFTLTIIS